MILGGVASHARWHPRDNSLDDAVVAAVSDEPARGGVIEDELLWRPGREYALSVCFDLLLDLVGNCGQWRSVGENLQEFTRKTT